MSAPMISVIFFAFFAAAVVLGNPIQTRDLPKNQNDGAAAFLQSLKDIGDSLTQDQKNQLKAIATNPDSTKRQIVDDLKNFFHSIGGEAETKYNAFYDQLESEGKKLEEAAKASEASMNEEEKQFVANANAINANMDITYAENTKQIQDLINSATPEMKAKIQQDITKFFETLKNKQ
uniref:Uncharacterized protein n=1 Tax=Panagrolaimus sp. PS1159 TaxID=55785 RepID=A0AC35GLI3_9BILA